MNPPKEGKYLAERCSLIQGLRGVMEEMTAKGTLTGAEVMPMSTGERLPWRISFLLGRYPR